jgi:SAM-dependent methyltransferase
MKALFKSILKALGVYHPLQSGYRQMLFNKRLQHAQKEYAKFKGEGFTCNICQQSYSRFVPDKPSLENNDAITRNEMIAGYGDNILCPNCLSTARERLVIARLSEMHLAGKRILHLSPEKNVYGYIKDHAAVTTADLLPGFYKTVDGLVRKEDATNFSFETGVFGIVIANHILEHIPADVKAMKEIYRVLKPGGKAILQVPYSEKLTSTQEMPDINDPVLQSKLFGQKDHVRNYALNDYVTRLRNAGFDVSVIPYSDLRKYYKNAIQINECFLDITKPVSA